MDDETLKVSQKDEKESRETELGRKGDWESQRDTEIDATSVV